MFSDSKKNLFCRLACLVLAGLMTVACFTACGAGDDIAETTAETDAQSGAAEETEAETVDEVAEAYRELGKVDWNGDAFTILYFQDFEKEIIGGGASGDVLSDAVYERNTLFEENCNLNLGTVKVDRNTSMTKVQAEVQSNSGDFHVCSVSMDQTANLATSNFLYNWLDMDIDLDKPWWDKGTAQFNLRDHIFFMNGSCNYADDEQTWVMIFNKDAFKKLDREEPYDVVTQNKWTLSYFETLIQDFSSDNGDTVWDEKDTYGFVATPGYSTSFFFGADMKYIVMDDEGDPAFNLVGGQLDKASDLVEQVQRIYHENNTTFSASDYAESAGIFKEGRGLFYGETAAWVVNLNKQMDGEFGVLPLPKYDDKQANYTTYVNYWANTFSVPKTIRKPDVIGDVLTYYSLLSHELVHPKYYDVVLTTKSAQDPQSIEMLDIVFANRVYDMATYFTKFEMSGIFSSVVSSNGDDFSSKVQSIKKSFNRKVSEIFKEID